MEGDVDDDLIQRWARSRSFILLSTTKVKISLMKCSKIATLPCISDLVAVVEDVVEVVDGERRRPRGHLGGDVAVVVDPHHHRQEGGGHGGDPGRDSKGPSQSQNSPREEGRNRLLSNIIEVCPCLQAARQKLEELESAYFQGGALHYV